MLNVGPRRLGYPKPVQREQRDQCMLSRRAEPGGDQQRAELVAVQRDRMGLVVQPRTANRATERLRHQVVNWRRSRA
jgi:hypothetical protein